MKISIPILALLLLSCNPEKHDIDKGIEEMAEYRDEMPVEDTVKQDCLFDTAYYRLTMDALRGIPDAKDITWLESEHTAVIIWRGDEVRRKRGGCTKFSDDLELITQDTTSLEDALHWLERAQKVSAHFGIPYFPKAIADGKAMFDPTMSDRYTKFFRLDIEPPDGRVIEGFMIQRIGDRTKLTFTQYQQ
jgi:hypothetical protein